MCVRHIQKAYADGLFAILQKQKEYNDATISSDYTQ